MPDSFVPPERPEEEKGDLLQQLLVVAAEKAAKREADDALKKGFVTREQINAALTAFGENLTNTIEGSVVDKITAQLLPQIQETVKKAAADAGMRKGTVQTPEDERDADPIAYLIKKGKEQGPDSYTHEDKQLLWGVTHAVLAKGWESSYDDGE